MFDKICEPYSLGIIIAVLLLVMVLIGTGKGLGGVVQPLLKKVLGHDGVNINIDRSKGDDPYDGVERRKRPPIDCVAVIEQTLCRSHQAEHERSLRNEKAIEELWNNYGKLRDTVTTGFKETQASIVQSQQVILTALASKK